MLKAEQNLKGYLSHGQLPFSERGWKFPVFECSVGTGLMYCATLDALLCNAPLTFLYCPFPIQGIRSISLLNDLVYTIVSTLPCTRSSSSHRLSLNVALV